ncbi:MAG: hypothetical protein HGA50_09290 [Deltaproteobacteria bacterium]|jgi:hypothetical protein|nr:hypothetical protein [Deltaproteobacteria bacterium]
MKLFTTLMGWRISIKWKMSTHKECRNDEMLEEWNDAVEIVKAVEVVQILGRPKQGSEEKRE